MARIKWPMNRTSFQRITSICIFCNTFVSPISRVIISIRRIIRRRIVCKTNSWTIGSAVRLMRIAIGMKNINIFLISNRLFRLLFTVKSRRRMLKITCKRWVLQFLLIYFLKIGLRVLKMCGLPFIIWIVHIVRLTINRKMLSRSNEARRTGNKRRVTIMARNLRYKEIGKAILMGKIFV